MRLGSIRFPAQLRRVLPARAAFVAIVLTLTLTGTSAAELSVTTIPGGVARWTGENLTSCGMSGRTFLPVDGACYYPVDLDRKPGHYEIARWREGGSIETAWLIVEPHEFEIQEIDLPDDTYVNLTPENQQRHWQEQALVKPALRKRGGDPTFSLPLGPPAQPLPEGRYFGLPREFNGVPKKAHSGLDYAIGMDNPVLSVADGTVLLTGDHFFAGKSVYVYHGNGLVSMYFHLNAIDVEQGQTVARGDAVGKVGSTGRSTGPHLHLGVRWHNAKVNPDHLLGDPSALPAVSE